MKNIRFLFIQLHPSFMAIARDSACDPEQTGIPAAGSNTRHLFVALPVYLKTHTKTKKP